MQITNPRLPFDIVMAVVPFVLAVGVLEFLGPEGKPLTKTQLYSLCEVQPSFVGASLTHVSVTVVHFIVCVCASFYFVMFFAGVGRPMQWRYFLFAALLALLLLLFLFVPVFSVRSGLRVHHFLFFNFEEIYYCESNGPDNTIMPLVCRFFPAFYWVAILPTTLGVIAAFAGTAAADLQKRLFTESENKDDGLCATRRRSLMHCSLVLAAVLTTSTISSSVWFHLPERIFDSHQQRELCKSQDCALEKLQRYADELTLFLGTVYTLTLFAVIAWPLWRLHRAGCRSGYGARARDPTSDKGAELPIGEGFQSALQVMAVLTPLISGLLSNWVQ